MTAAERVAAALKRRLNDAVRTQPEGDARRAAVASWFSDLSIASGYEERTIREWLKGAATPTLQSFLDLDTHWPGFAAEVIGQGAAQPATIAERFAVLRGELEELERIVGQGAAIPIRGVMR